MVLETHRRLALQLRLAVESLVGAPSPDSYNVLSKMLAALNRAGLSISALLTASSTMNEVCDRYGRVGRVGLKDEEVLALRQAIGEIESRLPQVPVNALRQAVAEVEVFCASVGA